MRVFYVIYIGDSEVARCVDAIRLLCDPQEKDRAHITVRGPYNRMLANVERFNKRIRGSIVRVHEVGYFFEPGQNTVLFKCEAPKLREIWYKPAYNNGFSPHITLYDGKSREFAENLLSIVAKYRYDLSFSIEGLSALRTQKGQQRMNLRMAFDPLLVKQLSGVAVRPHEIETMSEDGRLKIVESICSYLSRIGGNASFEELERRETRDSELPAAALKELEIPH